MKIVYFDCRNGVSGDMVLRALMDLGDCRDAIEEAISAAKPFTAEEHHDHHHGSHGDTGTGHGRSYLHVLELIQNSGFSARAKEYAAEIYRQIGNAEAKVHGATLETVHFHEVGRDDAIGNALGIGMALELLMPDRILVSEICDGQGTILCSHGEISVPVPAVKALMEESTFTFRTTEVNTELVTPSGLASLMGIGAEPADLFHGQGKILAETEARGSRETGREGLKAFFLEIETRENGRRK